MNGYAEVPTRKQLEGVIDKLVLVESSAEASAHDRGFAEFVLRKVANAGNGADQQAAAWCSYVETLPYRREQGEVLRDPKQTVGVSGVAVGGDCDDLVLAVLAGCKSLAVPCQAEIMATDAGWGFHIRARVGLPPLNPKVWCVIDPVWRSEAQWAMAERNAKNNALSGRSQWLSPPAQSLQGGDPTSSTPSWWMMVLLGMGLEHLVRRLFRHVRARSTRRSWASGTKQSKTSCGKPPEL